MATDQPSHHSFVPQNQLPPFLMHKHSALGVMSMFSLMQEHLKEMQGLRHGTGPIPGTPVPQGVEAGKLEASMSNLHK